MAIQTTIAAALQDKIDAKAGLKTAFERMGLTVGNAKLSEYPSILNTLPAWSRPSDWLEIDSLVTAGEQKTVGLYAIYPNVNDYGMTNTVAFTVTGNHVVDWGDGSALENVNSNVQAQHTYNYDNIPSNTECTRGYRQVRIIITPQSGQNITNLQFGKKHTSVVFGRVASQWLDINIGGTELTTFQFSGTNSYPNLLEKAKAVQSTNKCTSMSSMFSNCISIQSLNLSSFNTSSVTNMINMFNSCYSLQYLNLISFNTSAVTNMANMFNSCYSLQSINLSSFNTAAVTNMSIMFYYCSSLQSLNLSSFNTVSVTNMSNMFNSCYSLQYLNLSSFNTSAVTNMSYMFNNCYSLQSLNLSNTNVGAVTSISNFVNFATGTVSLIKCRIPQAKWSFSVANNPLSASELNLLFGDLATVTGQTITITGCTGSATCDRTIATNKGWTVVG